MDSVCKKEKGLASDLQNQSLTPIDADRSIFITAVDPIENSIVLWAEASTRTETRDREERLRDKQQIIRSFLNFVGKHPGEVNPTDVRAWRKSLEAEKSENTVYSYLSRVSSLLRMAEKIS